MTTGRVAYGPAEIEARLRRVGELSDLTTGRRLAAKVDMSPAAIALRLQRVGQLRRLCLELGRFAAPSALSGSLPDDEFSDDLARGAGGGVGAPRNDFAPVRRTRG